MRAVVMDKFGDGAVLKIKDMPEPQVGDRQVKLQVHAAAVNPIDWKIRSGKFEFAGEDDLPLVLGFDVAGVVVEVGADVDLEVGDAVFACMDQPHGGGYAEYVVVGLDALCVKPDILSFEEAAGIPCAGLTALQALQDVAHVQADQDVLINGASGGVGIFAVQIAKALDARVTAVCGASNVDFVRELGADRVVNYEEEDFTELDDAFDVIFDAVASSDYFKCRKILKPSSIYVTSKPGFDRKTKMYLRWLAGEKQADFVSVKPSADGLAFLSELAAAGKLSVVIDSRFGLDSVQQAHKRSETGRARGKIVLNVVEEAIENAVSALGEM